MPASDPGLPPAVVMLLADGRLPSGGHVHSFGLEEAVNQGVVVTEADAVAFTVASLETAGRTSAALAAAANRLGQAGGRPRSWRRLDGEADARMTVGPARTASRQLGRHLVRLTQSLGAVPHEALVRASPPGGDPHQAIALGVLVAALGGSAEEAATLALYGHISTTTTAAVRLLGIDPATTVAILARLAPWISDAAVEAASHTNRSPSFLPAPSTPTLDALLLDHAERDGRLFAT
jgi:urease accessory protein